MNATATMKNTVRQLGQHFRGDRMPSDFTADERALVRAVAPYTMTSPERIVGLVRAVEHVVDRGTTGAFVECGVWRGGSILAVARTLMRCGATDRELYLFDTFEGMSTPTHEDVSFDGEAASDALLAGQPDDLVHACAGLDLVRRVVGSAGYPGERLHFVKGTVEQTLPENAPDQIALLRLDTDWYASTRHELLHLYPRLVPGGVLVIDDYGHWQGARRAVDEYFAEHGIHLLLNRLDYTGRIAIKC